MTIQQQPQWDKEFNALTEKYNIAFACMLYISVKGDGEQQGAAVAVHKKGIAPAEMSRLVSIVTKTAQVFWDHDREIAEIVW